MNARRVRLLMLLLFSAFIAFSLRDAGHAQKPDASYKPVIPKTWDEAALADLEVPLADPSHRPQHISADIYYRIPVRPIYKSYPVYHPDKEPHGYREWIGRQKPLVIWDDGAHCPSLVTEADWIKAGEIVFNAPVLVFPATTSTEQDRAFVAKTGDLYDKNGISPFAHYVIREPGKIDIGVASCADCHTRVMPDGTLIKGAQGNRPLDRVAYFGVAEGAVKAEDKEKYLAEARQAEHRLFAAPWLRPDPNARLDQFSAAEIEAAHFAIPGGVIARQGTSPFSPAKVPDLIGTKERCYLDASGLVRHRSIGDLMRYAALNQGMDLLARYGNFIPVGTTDFRQSPDPTTQARYSDEQLYALALYIYSLKPPPNPNKRTPLTVQGKRVFQGEGCAMCHTPPLYTNNKLTPAEGFKIPDGDRTRFDILPLSVGTDPTLTLMTRRGTGYYKVPSLKGVWYRGPFEHNGSVATLEDWFDGKRLRHDYVPTGFRGYDAERREVRKTRAVKGHEFGLELSPEDKKALIAFLKTL